MTAVNSIYLVNAGNDAGISSIANDGSFPALGVLALGTWLQKTQPDLEVIVRDGQVRSTASIIAEIEAKKPGIVGVSVLSTSYQSALAIAEAAKDCGAYTVLGNDHAAQLSRKILEKRAYVDFVLGSEYGERPLELVIRSLRGEPIELGGIPDLTFRHNGEVVGFDYQRDKANLSIIHSSVYLGLSRATALDTFPVVDRKQFPVDHWRTYLENYLARFSNLHKGEEVTGVTTMNRARGCSRAKDPCSFCDMLLDVSLSSPKMFWGEVKEAHRQVGATVFYEVCDSFTSFPGLIEGIVQERPTLDFTPKFFVYAQAIEVVQRPQLVQLLQKMGVFSTAALA